MRFLILLSLFSCYALFAQEPISPIPLHVSFDQEKAALGKKLFFDPILSKDQTISCVSCHNLFYGGADSTAVSFGVRGQKGEMNAPTVLNAVFNFTQFYNGRAHTLREQALGPIHNPIEMGLLGDEAAARLSLNPFYKKAFANITHKTTINNEDIAQMIAEYEKTLITPNAKFDLFLRGKTSLSREEMRGYTLFKTLGCITCHNGINIGGNSFQKLGAIVAIPRTPNVNDRYALTHRERDKNIFKVPTLRNIALTAPYFHDGSATTLQEAIQKMSYHNLGIKLSKKEVHALVAFLDTLTGVLEERGKK